MASKSPESVARASRGRRDAARRAAPHGGRSAHGSRPRPRPGPRPRNQASSNRPVQRVRPEPRERPSRRVPTAEPRPILRVLATFAGRALLGLVILAVFVFGVFPTGSYVDQRQQLDEAERELSVLESDNEELRGLISRLESDTEIEREAREEFNLVLPNEESYLVLPPG